MKRICIILLAVFLVSEAAAQRARRVPQLSETQIKEYDRDGDDFFKSDNYKEALKRYERLITSDSNHVEWNYRLGVCYVMTSKDRKRSLGHLRFALEHVDDKAVDDDVYFYFAEGLRYNHEFNDAIDNYNKYKEIKSNKVDADLIVDQRIEWCKNAVTIMSNPIDVRFKNPGKTVNSPYPDIRPITGASDKVLFYSSNRKGNMGGIIDGFGEYVTDIYYSIHNDTIWKRAKNGGTFLNSPGYNEALALSMNSDKMLMFNEGGDARGDIYYSQMNGKQWVKPIDMGKTFKTKEIEEGAAMMEGIRVMYFSAALNGTLGGKDIWMRVKDTTTNEWGEPINLGENVNTPYDDINPFLFFDGKTLFFASEGHNSMGGFDLFKSEQPDPRQDWSKAQNLGYPVNTVDDNKYLTLDGSARVGYVSAVREEGLGEADIYKVRFREPLVQPAPTRVEIVPISPKTGLPERRAVCIVTVKNTGELIGTFNLNALAGSINLSLAAGEYRVKIRAPRSGKADADIEITGKERRGRKKFLFKLK